MYLTSVPEVHVVLPNLTVSDVSGLATFVGNECKANNGDYKWTCNGVCRKDDQVRVPDCLGLNEDLCNGVDDNCDGNIDQDPILLASIGTVSDLSPEIGDRCFEQGQPWNENFTWVCLNGSAKCQNTTESAPNYQQIRPATCLGADDETCDNDVDDDCDGDVDETPCQN